MSVTLAAKKLRLSQSTLSEQLKQFESIIGQELFIRSRRRLTLTESGNVALDYAEQIFLAGEEMLGVFQRRPSKAKTLAFKVGAVGPLSKNLQFEFVRPLLERDDVKLTVIASPLNLLLKALSQHEIDVVLSGYPARSEGGDAFHNDFLGEVEVLIVGQPPRKRFKREFPYWLDSLPLFVPTKDSRVRAEFDTLLERAGVRPIIKAEVEDMALLRVLALSGKAMALVPKIVVSGELRDHKLISFAKIDSLSERFYAISARRKFPHPLISEIIKEFSKRLGSMSKKSL